MRLFGDAKVLQGSIAWTSPFKMRFVQPPPVSEPLPAPALPEYDEDGRLFVFRFARTSPQSYTIERDRIFEYVKSRRLPDAGQRQIRRDVRNSADVFGDLRELTTHPDVREA